MTARIRNRRSEFQFKKLIVPMVVMLAFWGIAMWGFTASGLAMPLIMFGYIGTALGVGLGLYGTLPKKQKPIGRRLTLFLVGLFLIVFAIFFGQENSQLEGDFWPADRCHPDGGHPLRDREGLWPSVVWADVVWVGLLDGHGP